MCAHFYDCSYVILVFLLQMGQVSQKARSFVLQNPKIREQYIKLIVEISHGMRMKFFFSNELTGRYHGWTDIAGLSAKKRHRPFWICDDSPVSSVNLLTAHKLVANFYEKIKHHVCSIVSILAFAGELL